MIHKEAQKYIFFYIKKPLFLQKYIFTTVQFVKKQLFYIEMVLFYKDRFFMQHIYKYIFIIYEHLNKRVVLLLI